MSNGENIVPAKIETITDSAAETGRTVVAPVVTLGVTPGDDRAQRRLDQAVRAAWLYYIGEKTQDEIAQRLNISRQGVQRLIAVARTEGLVKFRVEARASDCAELAERLIDRFGLRFCDVVPSAGRGISDVALSAAEQIEAVLAQPGPTVLAIGSGRLLRGAVSQVAAARCPQHRIVSLVGNIARLGGASPYEVASRLSDITGAPYHPMPMPVIADSEEEAAQMRSQRLYRLLQDLVRQAHTHFVGVGNIGRGSPLHDDGFITDAEADELEALGAVGEICGRALDGMGNIVEGGTNRRVMAISLQDPTPTNRIGIAAGPLKVGPLRAALRGGWLSGVITDEPTARAVLEG